jgi:GMP synthase (glutamine-hydrolysing)
MKILVLRHAPFEHLGHFATILDARGDTCAYRDLGEPHGGLSLDGQDALIVLGGPMSANDPLPGLRTELALIGEALEKSVPVLGVCLGSQLIAKALGARVYRNEKLEIGWAPVSLTDDGRKDPVLGSVASPATLFHWHGETFDLPRGATWLACSEKCRHQAYRYGANVYGLQFHPEVTAEMVVDWSAQPVNCGDVATLDGPIDPHAVDQLPLAREILAAWLAIAAVRR